MLCAEQVNGNICIGDTGGFLGGSNSRLTHGWFVIQGIAEGSAACSDQDPSTFTNIFLFNDWIIEKTKN